MPRSLVWTLVRARELYEPFRDVQCVDVMFPACIATEAGLRRVGFAQHVLFPELVRPADPREISEDLVALLPP